jgi:hypothetical protein
MIEFVAYGSPAPQGSWAIYTLAGADGAVRYVGVTRQPIRRRLAAHLRRAAQGDTHKDRWLRRLIAAAAPLRCSIVESGAGDWKEAERRWIAVLRDGGCDLTNSTVGGEGCEGYTHTPAAREAMAARRRGKPMPPEQRAAISAALKGRRVSEAHREALRTRVVTNETRQRMAEAQKGHRVSDETLAKLSAARKGRPISDRAKASRPQQLTEAHKAAIALGVKNSARWSR